MGILDYVVGFGRIVATTIGEETRAVGAQVLADNGLEDDDATGELTDPQPFFGALGIIGRPLAPEKIGNVVYHAEVVCAKVGDGLVPIATRDNRLTRAVPLKEGQLAFAGYGGGLYTLDLTSGNSGSKRANIHVIYCPYDFSGDAPAKAHSIILDPTSGNESVVMTHGEGTQIAMKADKSVVTIIDAATFSSFKPGEFTVHAEKIMMKGNVYVGAQAELGVPLLPGVASPPCPSLFLSPL